MCRHIMDDMTSVYECAFTPKKEKSFSYISKYYNTYNDWDGWDEHYKNDVKVSEEWTKCEACDELVEAKSMKYARDFNCDVCESCHKWVEQM